MKTAPTSSRHLKRYHVVVLALALLLSVLVQAGHLHVGETGDRPSDPSKVCSVCVLVGSNAPPSPQPLLLAPTVGWSVVVLVAAAAVPLLRVAAPYRSRAPPV